MVLYERNVIYMVLYERNVIYLVLYERGNITASFVEPLKFQEKNEF